MRSSAGFSSSGAISTETESAPGRADADTNDSGVVRARFAPSRCESRVAVVQVVEYCRYPRRHASERRRIAYTQDRSDLGLGLDLPEPVTPGELLHVTVRDIEGRVDVDGLARVVWAEPAPRGRTRAGLAMLRERGDRSMRRVAAEAARDAAAELGGRDE